MTKNYSFVSQINQALDWAFTDQEVQAFKMLAMVGRPELKEMIAQMFEDANFLDIAKEIRPVTAETIAERYGLEENDDFMTALRDTMGEED
jgi:hypothetical protein